MRVKWLTQERPSHYSPKPIKVPTSWCAGNSATNVASGCAAGGFAGQARVPTPLRPSDILSAFSRTNRSMPTILIVDDSPTIRRMVRASLANLPATFAEAGTGLEGIETLAVSQIDAIVLDLNM